MSLIQTIRPPLKGPTDLPRARPTVW